MLPLRLWHGARVTIAFNTILFMFLKRSQPENPAHGVDRGNRFIFQVSSLTDFQADYTTGDIPPSILIAVPVT